MYTYEYAKIGRKNGFADGTGCIGFEQRLARKGRPVRNRVASARVTAAELKLLEEAAHAEGKLLAEWARDELLRAVRFSKDDALFTEVIATRLLLNELLGSIATSKAVTPEEFAATMTRIKLAKRKVAREVMRQYATVGDARN